jgi:hypothetical protein
MFQTLIASATVGVGGAATIDFTAIPATYTDLVLVLSARATSTTATITLSLNGSSASFTGRYLQGNGSAASSTTSTTLIGNASISTDTANTFGNLQLIIPNYASSNNKAFSVDVVTENNATSAFAQYFAGLWSNTAVINQVTLNLANFAQHSTAYLYGTLKGSGGATVS